MAPPQLTVFFTSTTDGGRGSEKEEAKRNLVEKEQFWELTKELVGALELTFKTAAWRSLQALCKSVLDSSSHTAAVT